MTVVIYNALLWDNFEHGSTRNWWVVDSGNGSCSRALEQGRLVKCGDNSMKFNITIGATPSGTHSLKSKQDYYETLIDLSNYDYIYAWVYTACTTSTPVLKFELHNDGVWSGDIACSGEVKDGWGLISAQLPSSRNKVSVIRFKISETDYSASESVIFYFDNICFIDTTRSFDLTNTDEDIHEQITFRIPEITFGEGIRPTFEGGMEGRIFTITGVIPETGTAALTREQQLEELLYSNLTFFLKTDYLGAFVKLNTYTANIASGRIYTVPYTITLVEYFGDTLKER